MSLHVEVVCDNIRDILQLNIPTQLELVGLEAPTGPAAGLSVPQPFQYFLGERDQYRAYEPPSIFIMPQRTVETRGQQDFNTALPQTHRVIVGCLIESTGQQELLRACMQMMQAITNILRDTDVTPQGITNRSTKVKIDSVDYGTSYSSGPLENRTFRREVWASLNVMHWDQLTPLPIQIPVLGAGYIEIGQVGSTSAVLGAVSEAGLTTTAPTSVLVATTGTSSGNYNVDVYYRVLAPCTITITTSYQDGTGNQVVTQVNGAHSPSSYRAVEVYFNCNGGVPITITATADVANVVFVSSTIWKAF